MNNHTKYDSQALSLMEVLKATGMSQAEVLQTVIEQRGEGSLHPSPESTDHEAALHVIKLLHRKFKMAPIDAIQSAFELFGAEAMHETSESSDEDAAVFLLTYMHRMGISSSDAYSFVTGRYGSSALDEKIRFIEANKDKDEEHLEDLDQIENNIRDSAQGNFGKSFRFWYSEPSGDAPEWVLWAAGAGDLPIEIVGIRRTDEAAQALVLKDQKKFQKKWPSLLSEAKRLMKSHKQHMNKNAKKLDQESREFLQNKLEMYEQVIEYLQVALNWA